MKQGTKTVFICQSCGYKAAKWMGRCPDCDQWDTFIEEVRRTTFGQKKSGFHKSDQSKPVPIDSVTIEHDKRLTSQISEFDRVLGGGLVPGTLVLIGGDPGIGKSTLMLQSLHRFAENGCKVLYVSGEESIKQLRIRAKRLDTVSSKLLVVSEIDIESILSMVDTEQPQVMVVDSIQTMFSSDLSSAPGSIGQVRENAMRLMLMAKNKGIPVFLVGHVTKDGMIAGPKVLEHMVDTVLYFEGDRNHVFRILRSVKNRFGSTNEIGVFEMKESGLEEVSNPSAVFLSERPEDSAGSVVTAAMEGTRPILIEIQALTSSTNLGTPRRTILGLDQNRVSLLVAVLEKSVGLHLVGHDIFMNVAGGVKIDEPAADLGIVAALSSSFLDRPIQRGSVAMGEIGLTGEIRGIGQLETRIAEAKKMGFSRCLAPENNLKRINRIGGIELVGIKTVSEAIDVLF